MNDRRDSKAVSAEVCFDFPDKLIVPISDAYLKFSAIFIFCLEKKVML